MPEVVYPDFSYWKENAIEWAGLRFAPEDFYVVDEQGRRKTHFAWDEAIEYEEKVMKPNGWRLPTDNEWYQARAYRFAIGRQFFYGDLLKCLRLNLNGVVTTCGNSEEESLREVGRAGFYWTSDDAVFSSSSLNPRAFPPRAIVLGVDYEGDTHGDVSMEKVFQVSVRCVAL